MTNMKLLYPENDVFSLLGVLMNEPKLLVQPETNFSKEDFESKFHKIVYVAIYNLAKEQGILDDIDALDISKYIAKYPEYKEVFDSNKGAEFVTDAKETAKKGNFKALYDIIKKYSLLRQYVKIGVDVSDLIDTSTDNISIQNDGVKRVQSMSPDDIVDYFSSKLLRVKNAWREQNSSSLAFAGGDNIFELVEKLQTEPDIGYPFDDPYYTTLLRGMRSGRYILRSTDTGGGKTRTALASALRASCSERFNLKTKEWESMGDNLPVLLISTEIEKDEIQVLELAYLTGIPSGIISDGKFTDFDKERIEHAARVLQESDMYFVYIDDYNTSDIQAIVEEYSITHQTKIVFFDYIQACPRLMKEAKESYGSGLREDQALANLSRRLKDIAQQEKVCIVSATQVNADFNNETSPRVSRTYQTLRGGKATADKADAGIIMAKATGVDIDKLQKAGALQGADETPNYSHWIYKNRSDEANLVIWSKESLGNMRSEDLFVTDYQYNRRDDIVPLVYQPKVSD